MGDALVAWSGGKDAAYALHARRQRGHEVAGLLTELTATTGRSRTHAVPRACYERQAAALGCPVSFVELPPSPSNEAYECRLTAALAEHADRGVDRIVYADLHLEGVRAYREGRLADTALEGDWPLWGRDTAELARAIIDAGIEATVVVANGERLDAEFVGRRFDGPFLADLPAGVDPCGEAGEFHTFVHDGPGFEAPVPFEVTGTGTRERDGTPYHYATCRLAE